MPPSKAVVFTRPGVAELRNVPAPDGVLDPKDILIETEFSVVSAGTELACLAGQEWWAPLPFTPGYASVGRVVEAGAASPVAKGQRVFTFGPHAKLARAQTLTIALSDSIDPAKATFARLASIAITALRVSDAELGDTVAVFGLGLIGNLAAQLFTLAGCEVIGIDVSPRRRELARTCGIAHVLDAANDVKKAVAALTGGKMCQTVVEATGVPAVAETAGTLAGKQGEVILLGSPRGEYRTDLTPLLNRTHLWGEGCVTLKGAHEWRFPVLDDTEGYRRHSLERNVRQILRLIEDERLCIDPLLTHRTSPADCQVVYDGVKHQKDAYIGVVYDWSRV